MTREESNLLLYLETCAVDGRGMCHSGRMNTQDFEIASRWHDTKFIRFGRRTAAAIIKASKLRAAPGPATHLVVLSDKAWSTAHRLRRERAERMLSPETHGIRVRQKPAKEEKP